MSGRPDSISGELVQFIFRRPHSFAIGNDLQAGGMIVKKHIASAKGKGSPSMGIKGKLFALAASAVLMLAGLGGSIYPLLAGESVSIDSLSSMSTGEHDNTWSGPEAESTLSDYFAVDRSTAIQLMAVGGVVGTLGILMTNRSRSVDVTTA